MMKESLLLRWDMDRILMKSLMRRTDIRLIRRRTNFSITKDGEIIKAQMTNEKIPIYPQTGDKGSPGFWAALSILSISGAVFTYLGLRRRKNNLSNRERKE